MLPSRRYSNGLPVNGLTGIGTSVTSSSEAGSLPSAVQPREDLVGHTRLPGQLDQGLLNAVVRAITQLPGVQLQRRTVLVQEPGEQLGPGRPRRVGITSFHHAQHAARGLSSRTIPKTDAICR